MIRAVSTVRSLVAVVSISLAIPQAASAHALTAQDAQSIDAGHYVWRDQPVSAAPLRIVISIADQRAYVYRGKQMIAIAAVSTGKEGHETPTGSFSILQKAVTHHSNKYDNAVMPYMQRLTWDGVAMHAGHDPGFPNSHGCIRLPLGFAKQLYVTTKLGGSVTITDDPIAADMSLHVDQPVPPVAKPEAPVSPALASPVPVPVPPAPPEAQAKGLGAP